MKRFFLWCGSTWVAFVRSVGAYFETSPILMASSISFGGGILFVTFLMVVGDKLASAPATTLDRTTILIALEQKAARCEGWDEGMVRALDVPVHLHTRGRIFAISRHEVVLVSVSFGDGPCREEGPPFLFEDRHLIVQPGTFVSGTNSSNPRVLRVFDASRQQITFLVTKANSSLARK